MADMQPIIIIRKKKKGGGEGHHGGAWKVAYADFVTAMMAFFLLLWLLNVTTDEQRHGIADYFTPASIARSESGAGGMMGGQTITAPGAMISRGTPPIMQEKTIPSLGQGEEGSEDTVGKSDHGSDGANDAGGRAGKEPDQKKLAGETLTPEEKAEKAAHEAAEQARFEKAAEELKQALQDNPALQGLSDQMLIDQTPDGLRIQIVDKENSSMFPSGSAILYEKSRLMLGLVGQVLARLPNELSIAGHTDSAAFSAGSRRDNWTLSTERANVCRLALVGAGVKADRVARVIGMADREPLDKNPQGPRNRRISITLLREAFVPGVEEQHTPAPLLQREPGQPLLPSVLPGGQP